MKKSILISFMLLCMNVASYGIDVNSNSFALQTQINAVSTIANSSGVWKSNGTNIYNANTGNVGIGNVNPTKKLHVSGGNIGIDNGSGIVDNTYGHSIFISSCDNNYTDKTIIRIPNDIAGNSVDIQQYSGTSIARFLQGGNVGIGTTNPLYKLDVNADTIVGMRLQSSGRAVLRISPSLITGDPESRNWSLAADKNAYGDFVISKSLAAGGDAQVGNDVITILNSGNVGIGVTNPTQMLNVIGNISLGTRAQSALTRYVGLTAVDGTFSSDDNAGTLGMILDQAATGDTMIQFKTGVWGNNEKIKMTILGNGNVGIGVTNPEHKLSVIGDSAYSGVVWSSGGFISDTNYVIKKENTVANNWEGYMFESGGKSQVAHSYGSYGAFITGGVTGEALHINNVGNYPIEFGTNDTSRMVIKGDGNVGIDVTNPTAKLDVNGLIVSTSCIVNGTLNTNKIVVSSESFCKLNCFDRGKTTTLTTQDAYYSIVGTTTLAVDSAWFNVSGTIVTYVGITKKFTIRGMTCGSVNATNEIMGLALYYNNAKIEYEGYTRNSNNTDGMIYQQTVFMEKTLTAGDTLDMRIANESSAGKVYTIFVWTLTCIPIN